MSNYQNQQNNSAGGELRTNLVGEDAVEELELAKRGARRRGTTGRPRGVWMMEGSWGLASGETERRSRKGKGGSGEDRVVDGESVHPPGGAECKRGLRPGVVGGILSALSQYLFCAIDCCCLWASSSSFDRALSRCDDVSSDVCNSIVFEFCKFSRSFFSNF